MSASDLVHPKMYEGPAEDCRRHPKIAEVQTKDAEDYWRSPYDNPRAAEHWQRFGGSFLLLFGVTDR